jgi:glycine/D-amino acid oxidase-like deaminating enzyme
MTLPYEIVSHVSGVRPTVSDRRPLVGQHPEYKNLFVLNGMGSRGVMTAPTAANALSSYIYDGIALDPEMDVARFLS